MKNKIMGRAGKSNKAKRVAAEKIDPVMHQALANGAKLGRGQYEVQFVPNPHGEVEHAGQVVRHRSVRNLPQFELLYRRHVIDHRARAVLAWYDERMATANMGMIRNPLGDQTGGGGSAGAGIPLNQTALDASRDVDWARAQIIAASPAGYSRALIDVFDAVMRDELTFVEAARRECADRHVRASVSRERAAMAKQFVAAAKALTAAYEQRFPKGPGRILTATW